MVAGIFIVFFLAAGFLSAYSVEPPGIFAYSDRMVYGRPADVLLFGVVLDEDGRPVPRANLSIDVFNPVGDVVFSAELMAGDDGRFSRGFRLSDSAEEGEYQVQVVDLDGNYGSSSFSFEVCQLCAIPPPTVTVTSTVLRTATVVSTFTRNVTWVNTVFKTVSGGQVVTVTSFSVVNGSVVTVEVTRTVGSGFESVYLFYVGLGMVVVLAVASAIVARRVGSRSGG
ncbi:MAG: MG2 domain-containing protein [Nitrososphaerota archaeon]